MPSNFPEPMHQLVTTVAAPTSALGDPDGQIRPAGVQGLYVADARVLRAAQLTVDGREPASLGWAHTAPGATAYYGVALGLGDVSPDPTVRIERLRVARVDGVEETIRISSTAQEPVHATVTVTLTPDVTPLETVRRGRTAPPLVTTTDGSGFAWERDGVHATVAAPGARLDGTAASWEVSIGHGEVVTMSWSLRVRDQIRLLVAAEGPAGWSMPTVTSPDPRLQRLIRQSLEDLSALRLSDTATPDGAFIAAGVPWFLTLFGRDSLWAARMMLPLGPELAETTLRTLARRQGTRVDIDECEEPGKIMHELRRADIWEPRTKVAESGPMVYFGSVDATLLWINLLADAWRWGMPEETVASFIPYMQRALNWLAHYGDPTGSGFISYLDKTGRGLANQGWKDSGTSVRFRDGAMATPPIALCEVQAYAHRAALDGAELLDAFRDGRDADRWRSYASGLADRFRDRFWVDGPLGAHPALALDRDGRPVDSLTSNIGHLLGTGLLNKAEEHQVARMLGTPALAGGHGLRTMSTIDAAYDPMSYHCGGIWPHDTAIALLGLASLPDDADAKASAIQLANGLLTAAEAFDFRLPEFYCGDGRDEISRPLAHPSACRPQAWAATAAIALLQAALGLTVSAPGKLHAAPLGLGPIEVRGLRFAGAPLDVSVALDGAVQVTSIASAPVPRQSTRAESIESIETGA
jgi:glycogen debranching enzyme